jgi:hypothetical protein
VEKYNRHTTVEGILPWDLTINSLEVDPAAVGSGLEHELRRLYDDFGNDPLGLMRVLLAAGLLFDHQDGHVSPAEAIHTAVIWERG